MASELIDRLKTRDAEYVRTAMKIFKDQARDIVEKIREDDKITLEKWREKDKAKIELVVARRLLRLDMIIESRCGETVLEIRDAQGGMIPTEKTPEYLAQVREEAIRRATNLEPLMNVMKEDMKDFETASQENIEQIITTMADEDRIFRIHTVCIDKEFTDKLAKDPSVDFDKVIADRDKKRSDRVAIRLTKRDKESREIFKDSSDINLKLLADVDNLSLDTYEERALGGHSLEDYCFDD